MDGLVGNDSHCFIGGINKQTVPNYKEKGIDGIAVVSAIVSQPDVKVAVKEMWKLWKDENGSKALSLTWTVPPWIPWI